MTLESVSEIRGGGACSTPHLPSDCAPCSPCSPPSPLVIGLHGSLFSPLTSGNPAYSARDARLRELPSVGDPEQPEKPPPHTSDLTDSTTVYFITK